MRQQPDLVVLGGGGAGAMAMLWTLAAGRRAVGVPGADPPSDPLLGPGATWCLPAGVHRHLELLDRLLLRRYGPDGVPARADGSRWRLADALRPTDPALAGGAVEVREEWTDGESRATVTATWPAVLRVPATELLAELWGYLAAVEATDRHAGRAPRVRVLSGHAVAGQSMAGRVRLTAPDGATVDLGDSELVLLDDHPAGAAARACGVTAAPLVVDHGDGRGPTLARAHLVVGALDTSVGDLCRRRVAPAFDEDHDEYRVRQVAVGRGPTGMPAWLAVQVPEYHVFDPVEAGLVPPGTPPDSPDHLDAVRLLVRRLFVTAAAELLQRPEAALDGAIRGGPDRPRLVSATAWRPVGPPSDGAGQLIAVGDTVGGGHPLHPLRPVTGPFRHGHRVRRYWRRRAAGTGAGEAALALAVEVAADTAEWINASISDFAEPPQFHFNADCFAELAYARAHREHFAALEAGRPAHPALLDGVPR
ncbi:hypothetical protein ACFY2R_20050 [Micromonospora olivasterospora]|uniref:Uncharacterized protein n=2 Tax=Micromonospora olivasterospora TaxID=1880 RepID=A0A562I7Y0_MICOL|nr:hypothetical protein [Micromonospora olivasterospora]TWH67120.1 hypothetical protein JD77_02089 [Micromonospora olivasterospora]